VVKLLEEIRDLQRQYNENYQKALKNQEESLAQNRAWRKQMRGGQWWFLGILIAVMFALWLAAVVNR